MEPPRGLPLAVDPDAGSTEAGVPAFIARPADQPVYYGFPVLDDVVVDYFRFGMITDFKREPSTYGDAFVVAPDGSRAGLIWETPDEPGHRPGAFDEVCALESGRWGVWAVAFPYPMRTSTDARRNLEAVLPKLREQWDRWRQIDFTMSE